MNFIFIVLIVSKQAFCFLGLSENSEIGFKPSSYWITKKERETHCASWFLNINFNHLFFLKEMMFIFLMPHRFCFYCFLLNNLFIFDLPYSVCSEFFQSFLFLICFLSNFLFSFASKYIFLPVFISLSNINKMCKRSRIFQDDGCIIAAYYQMQYKQFT